MELGELLDPELFEYPTGGVDIVGIVVVVRRKVGEKGKEKNAKINAVPDHRNLIYPRRDQSMHNKVLILHACIIVLVLDITCINYTKPKFFY